MATMDAAIAAERERARDEWVARVTELVARVEGWARELDWSTLRIDKKLTDTDLGEHRVPALVMQKEFARLLLEPIGWDVVGAEGVVDLYLMPAWDDVARLVSSGGNWQVLRFAPRSSDGGERNGIEVPLTKETFGQVVEAMVSRGE